MMLSTSSLPRVGHGPIPNSVAEGGGRHFHLAASLDFDIVYAKRMKYLRVRAEECDSEREFTCRFDL